MQLLDLVRDYGRTLVESLVGCCFLAATWAAQRTRRWLLELLERERAESEAMLARHRAGEVQRHNETLKTFYEASERAERHTLEELLDNAERDFSLESSETPSPPPTPVGPPTTPRRSPNPALIDWSDEETQSLNPSKWSPPNNGE